MIEKEEKREGHPYQNILPSSTYMHICFVSFPYYKYYFMAFTHATFLHLLIYNILSFADIHLHPLLQIYLSSSNAVRIRILPRAVAYLNNIGAEILNEQLPRLSISNLKQRINNGQGYILLSRIRVSRYKRPTEHIISTSAPNKIIWIMKNLNIGLIGSLSGEVNILVPMKLEGEAEVLAYGVNFQLESALERSETGRARVSIIFCRTTIQLMNIEIHNGGMTGIALNLFKQLVSRILIDFRLNEDPLCYKNTVEISNMGEISLIIGQNIKKTPFSAAPMFWPKKPLQNAMIHLLISDYIANALLYHAFSERLLQFVVDDQTISSLGPLLRTSCTTGICFADLIPQIAEQYPDSKVRLTFTPTRAPVVLFQAKQGGVLMANINGLVFMYIVESNKISHQAAAFALDIVANIKLHVELKNKYGYINISDDELSDVALLSSEMLQRFINDFLRGGFPIPVPKVLRINITQLQILDRSVFISADFALDRKRVNNLALQAFTDVKYFPPSEHIQSN
uniref:LBP / BPI / CETP family, C-terminal domain containing protein n=1 Tax=Brugia malayi TaxID=6279 RepID=A0A5S6PIR7_BRUMA